MIRQANQPFSFNDFFRLLLQNRKQAGIYGLILIIISFNLGLFLPANMHTPAAERMINVVQLTCFAIMGIFNVWCFYKRNFLAELSLSGARLAFICLLFIVIGLVLFVYYYLSGNNNLIMAFASSGAFLLPFLIYQGWVEFMGIPEKTYPVWFLQVEAGDKISLQALSTTNTIQVQLTILRKLRDDENHTFPVTTSGKLKLGKIFERFIEEQRMQGEQAAIEITDYAPGLFGWQFYEERWMGFYKRNLNPAMSLLENKINANAKITVVRVYKENIQK